MKLKKLFVIICILTIICNMFSSFTVSAFTNDVKRSENWLPSADIKSDWHSPASVEGFEDYVSIDSRFTVMSRNSYDLNNTKFIINNPQIPEGYWVSLIVGSNQVNSPLWGTDPQGGYLCLLLEKKSGSLCVSVWINNSVVQIGTFAPSETYEFQFVNRADVDYNSGNATYTEEYVLRVNNNYVSSETYGVSLISAFWKSSTFSKSYISVGCSNYFMANLKICQEKNFISGNTNGLYNGTEFTDDGFQKIYAQNSSYSVSSGFNVNLIENSFYLNSVKWNTNLDTAININFSYLYRYGQALLRSSKNNFGLYLKRTSDGTVKVYLNSNLGVSLSLPDIKQSDTYKIGFASNGDGTYSLLINDYCFQNDIINNFAAFSAEKCYISLSTNNSFEANVKVAARNNGKWILDSWNSPLISNTNDEGEEIYSLSYYNSMATLQKRNMFENRLNIKNANFGNGERAFVLGFSTTHIGCSRENVPQNGKLVFDVYTLNDSEGNCSGLRVHTGMGAQLGPIVPPAESYVIGLCKEDGNYYLKINDSLFSSSSITTFCKQYAESAYISITPYSNTMTFGLDVFEIGKGFSITSDIYEISKTMLSKITAYSSPNEIIKKLNITGGYDFKITDNRGVERTFADMVATDDKLVVTYKNKDVEKIDISVGGDLNSDALVNSQDLITLRKLLFGSIELNGVYKKAADVNSDNSFNIIDLVSTKKQSLAYDKTRNELGSLVDYIVEVENGKQPVVLQLTDTLIIDSSQQQNNTLSSYQTEFWSADKKIERCYDYIRETIENTKPHLIVITGNMVYGSFDNNGTAFADFVKFMDSFGIPWAPVFGNYDNESAMGADWQCDQLESTEYCLFKQRQLTGNGNYSVGILQNNKLLRAFYMLDSNGCKNASYESLSNNHTVKELGFGKDQIKWYTKSINKTKEKSPNTKIAFAYNIGQSVFANSLEKYGFTNKGTKEKPINLNKLPECEAGDFGYIGEDINIAWDNDNTVWEGIKALGADLILVGGEHSNSSSIVYNGVRLQYGQKSSTYNYYNNVTNDGTVIGMYPEENNYTPLIGGSVIPLNSLNGSVTEPYIYYCAKAGGDIGWSKAVTLNVSDFGAVGDGVTDDGDAIYNALEAFMKCGAGSKLVFENKRYFIDSNSNRNIRALDFKNMYSCAVEGNGATILSGTEMVYMSVNNCVDFKINDLNFDRKIRSHFVGTINAIDKTAGYIDVVSDRDFGFSGEYITPHDMFGFAVEEDGTVVRKYIYIDKISTINASQLKYRIYHEKNGALGTDTHVSQLKIGGKIVLPTPNIGHCMPDDIVISHNKDLTLKNVRVLNGADFVFHILNNEGVLIFDNVDINSDEETKFVTWRDGFHCKNNRSQIIWKNCDAVGLGDDIINISAYIMYVSNVISSNEIICTWPITNASYGIVNVGDKVTVYDVNTGKLIGKTTIKSVVDANKNHYILSDSLSGITSGENIRLYFDNHAAPNSQIINCNFEGTIRFKGAGGLAKDSRLKLYCMFMYPETNLEGPIPHDITFSNCDFTGTWEGRIEITCFSPVNNWQLGYYRIENIKFENCIGLKKSHFKYQNNFVSSSPDYITVSPSRSI